MWLHISMLTFHMLVAVQCYFAETMGRRIITIVSVGEGIFYTLQDGAERRKADKNKTIWEVIHDQDRAVGLRVPIFLFGFITLNRGVSTRSTNRVVTHLQLGLGFGHPIDSAIQGMGRATGNVKSVLERNLGQNAKIKVLMYKSDYDAAQAYVGYCASRGQRKVPEKLAKTHDFSAITPRRIGQRRGQDSRQCWKNRQYWKNQRQNNSHDTLDKLAVGQESTKSIIYGDLNTNNIHENEDKRINQKRSREVASDGRQEEEEMERKRPDNSAGQVKGG